MAGTWCTACRWCCIVGSEQTCLVYNCRVYYKRSNNCPDYVEKDSEENMALSITGKCPTCKGYYSVGDSERCIILKRLLVHRYPPINGCTAYVEKRNKSLCTTCANEKTCEVYNGHLDTVVGCPVYVKEKRNKSLCTTCANEKTCEVHNRHLDTPVVGCPIYVKEKENMEETSCTEKAQNSENVDHPNHYNQGSPEAIEIIEGWNLNFHLGNAIKYILRSPYKGSEKEDIRKALWYLHRHQNNIGGKEAFIKTGSSWYDDDILSVVTLEDLLTVEILPLDCYNEAEIVSVIMEIIKSLSEAAGKIAEMVLTSHTRGEGKGD